jgi:hypothetical protein
MTVVADQVFVLRFWRESRAAEASADEWRVRISYVNTRNRLHVDGTGAAFEIVQSLLDVAAATALDR